MSFIGSELDNCPPSSAKNTPGTYFRFVVDTIENAFKSRFDLNLHEVDSCEERAISLIPSMTGVDKKRKRHKGFKEAPLASVVIGADHGVLLIDKPDVHANWWHPLGFDPKTIASVDK